MIEGEGGNDRYLIARNYAFERPELATLLEDIDERPYLDPTRRQGLALWFGPAGTNTPLHHDTCQIMFAQIHGVKRFSLIPPHAQSLFDQATAMYSDLDPALELPMDTRAAVRTSGVLGDQFIALEPGGEEDLLTSGEPIQFTDPALSLECLIAKFVHDSGIED